MAAYREHITVSGLLGIAFGATSVFLADFTPVQGALAACLTWMAGMLPDLDSSSGRPIRELFGLTAAMAPLVMMQHLLNWADSTEEALFAAIALYAAIRYGAAAFMRRLAVHRGMFHSIPAMLIAGELVFLGYESDSLSVRCLMVGGTLLGFLSHLVLDEMYSVSWSGISLKLNSSAGSAVKLWGKGLLANFVTYSLLAVLTYIVVIDAGLLKDPPHRSWPIFNDGFGV
ncbi:MAG: metal-dependent hydrolase [Planctomycetaceae bacterium]